jgi:hypothetical protein
MATVLAAEPQLQIAELPQLHLAGGGLIEQGTGDHHHDAQKRLAGRRGGTHPTDRLACPLSAARAGIADVSALPLRRRARDAPPARGE